MSKALTIDELKVLQVGDWVWVTTADNKYGTYGRVCQKFDDENFRVETIESYIVDLYSDYGTKWLAYKNKEQAEAKGEIVELPCKIGDTFYGLPNKIDAPNQYFEYTVKGIEYRQDGVYLRTIYDMNFKYGDEAFMAEPKAKIERRLTELRGEEL